MNAAVRAVTRAALARGAEVFGVRNGYAGLLADSLKPLQARDVGGIVQHGGTVLGSARCPEFAEPSGRSAALRNLAARGIGGVKALMQHYAEQRDSIGFELRVTRLGHVVRGGSPTAADRILATRLGSAAVDCLASGQRGVLVGAAYNEIVTTPLSEIAGRTRPADAALLELARVMAI